MDQKKNEILLRFVCVFVLRDYFVKQTNAVPNHSSSIRFLHPGPFTSRNSDYTKVVVCIGCRSANTEQGNDLVKLVMKQKIKSHVGFLTVKRE